MSDAICVNNNWKRDIRVNYIWLMPDAESEWILLFLWLFMSGRWQLSLSSNVADWFFLFLFPA